MKRTKIVVFTGAGVSADSGIATFRDADGLWANYRIEDVCTPEALMRDRATVVEFYNKRRKELFEKEPNAAHYAIAELEQLFDVEVVTQNVDNLHEIKQADYEAEMVAQMARAKMEKEKQHADTVVHAEIEKEQIVIQAEAEAEKRRREAQGEADAIYAKLAAEAKGNFEILKAKGEGYNQLIASCAGSPDAAAKMLLIEKLEDIVRLQTEAIRNIKIDKVTVWDNGKGSDGKNSTANFLSGMMQSLPPLHDVAGMAGIDLPSYLGKVQENTSSAPAAEEAK